MCSSGVNCTHPPQEHGLGLICLSNLRGKCKRDGKCPFRHVPRIDPMHRPPPEAPTACPPAPRPVPKGGFGAGPSAPAANPPTSSPAGPPVGGGKQPGHTGVHLGTFKQVKTVTVPAPSEPLELPQCIYISHLPSTWDQERLSKELTARSLQCKAFRCVSTEGQGVAAYVLPSNIDDLDKFETELESVGESDSTVQVQLAMMSFPSSGIVPPDASLWVSAPQGPRERSKERAEQSQSRGDYKSRYRTSGSETARSSGHRDADWSRDRRESYEDRPSSSYSRDNRDSRRCTIQTDLTPI